MRVVQAVILCAGLAACARTFQVPITGQASNGQMLQGAITASTNGEGSFWIETLAGLRCDGVYNPLDPSPTIEVSATCNNGKTARILATRQVNGFSGVGTAQLSDGTTARFVFGDLRFSQGYN